MSNSSHTIAIVGRPNVGKSAIFNRLARRRIAIVHDQPGVTRDRISTQIDLRSQTVQLIDTGGIGASIDDEFAEQVRAEVDIALEVASLLLFTVDVREGLTTVDQALAQTLRSTERPVILLVNKVDNASQEEHIHEFASLGFETVIGISAEHGLGFQELEKLLLDHLSELPKTKQPTDFKNPKTPTKVAIVGRPNVGKSSLINAILKDERTIVSDVAGTTRDAVDVPYEVSGRHFNLIDTAGIRKRTSRDSPVEVFSVMRSEKSIRRADLCLLVVDAAGGIVGQDRRIARLILDERKPCLIVANKFDLFHPGASRKDRLEELKELVRQELFFLHYAPLIATSAKLGSHVGRVFHEIEKVQEGARKEINTGALNRLLGFALQKSPPPMRHGKRLKLLYAANKRDDEPGPIPVPHFILFINHLSLLASNYPRYLEGQIRKEEPYYGLPLHLDWRARPPRKRGKKGGKKEETS